VVKTKPENREYGARPSIKHQIGTLGERAIQLCKKATDREPNNLGAHLALAVAYSVSNREEEARAVGAEILRIEPKFSAEYYSKTLTYKNQTDKDVFIAALRKAGLE
jgi:tetratricopeptide (TPR) repeat protein